MMKNILLSLLLVFILLPNSNANHISLGSKISYKALNQDQYLVTLKIYRDCTGVNIGSNLNVTIKSENNSSTTHSLSRVRITDISPLCSKLESTCINSSSTTGIGVEENVYEDTIDFTQAPYNTWIQNGVCNIRFEFRNCCRSPITTIQQGSSNYTYSSLNLCNIKKTKKHQNNGLEFLSSRLLMACCNVPVYYNPNLAENKEKDSISYSLVNPMDDYNKPVGFNSGFDSTHPVTSKCPSSNLNCKPYPYAKTPIGFYIDPIKGDVIFTPKKCDENGIFVIEAKEYRKDSSGNYLHIGTSMDEVRVNVFNCGSNLSPEIKATKYDYIICAGDNIKFDMEGKDATLISGIYSDTVQLSWNKTIPNATFTISDTNSREKKASFEWQTTMSDINNLPYYFTVTAKDDFCPIYSTVMRSFSIIVVPEIELESKIITSKCDKLKVSASLKKKNKYTSYSWELYDSINPTILIDAKNNVSDSFQILKASTFYIKLSINHYNSCTKIYWDTVRVKPLQNTLELGKDTTISFLDSFVLKAGAANKNFLWNNNSRDSSLVLKPKDMKPGIYKYSVEVTNSLGCIYIDSIKITLDPCKNNPLPTIHTLKDTFVICSGNLLSFDLEVKDTTNKNYARKDTTFINYQSNYGTFTILDLNSLNKEGTFQWQPSNKDVVDSFYKLSFEFFDDNCATQIQTKIIYVKVLPSPNAQFYNSIQCGLFKMKASLNTDIILPVKYHWEIVDNNTTQKVFTSTLSNPEYTVIKESSYKIILNLENGHGCKSEFNETRTLTPYTNKDLIGTDRILYSLDTLVLSPGIYEEYYWSDATTANSLELVGHKLGLGKTTIELKAIDNNGCAYYDTIEIDVQCTPNALNIGNNTTIGLWESITLESNRDFSSYLWNNKATTHSVVLQGHLLGLGVHTVFLETTDQANCTYKDEIVVTVIDNTVSIKESELKPLVVYPSPTKDNIFIDLPTNFEKGIVRILDLNGKVVLREEIVKANKKLEIRTIHLPQGTYLIELEDLRSEKIYKNKFIKK